MSRPVIVLETATCGCKDGQVDTYTHTHTHTHTNTKKTNVSWCSRYGKTVWSTEVPQKPKVELPYDSAIPLLGTYPDKITIQKDTCAPVFIPALLTIAKTWKQSRCPSAEE